MLAIWNQTTWNSGALWGPGTPPLSPNQNKKPKNKPMKRQDYYPTKQAEQPEWLPTFAIKLLERGAEVPLATTIIAVATCRAACSRACRTVE